MQMPTERGVDGGHDNERESGHDQGARGSLQSLPASGDAAGDVRLCDACGARPGYPVDELALCTECVLLTPQWMSRAEQYLKSVFLDAELDLQPHQIAFLLQNPTDELLEKFSQVPTLLVFPDKDVTMAVVQPEALAFRLRTAPQGLPEALSFATILTLSAQRANVAKAETLEQAAEAERYVAGLEKGLELMAALFPGVVDAVRSEILAQAMDNTRHKNDEERG